MFSLKIFTSTVVLLLSVSSAIGSDNAFFDDPPNKPTECPPGDPNGSLITLPHERECNKFYVCIDGNKNEQECPDGLHFDPKQGICDWPSVANCQLTTTHRPSTTTTKKPITTTSVKPTTTQNPNSTSSTTPAKPTTTQKPNPPSSTAPTTTTQKPNPPSSTTPAKPTTTQKPNPPTTTTIKPTTTNKPNITTTTLQPSTTTKKPNITTTTIRPTTTNKPNITTTTLQPTTTTKKPNVTTTIRPTTTSKPNITTTTLQPTTTTKKPDYPTTCPKEDPLDPILLPHECDCDKYYLCRNGNQILKKCPRGLHFNPTIHDCDLPEDAGCLPSTPEPEPPVTPASDCPPVGPNGEAVHIPHETNCSLFYTCTGAGKVLQECPSGLHFNPKLQVCDWPWNVNCTNKPVSTLRPTTTTQRITTSSRKPSSTSRRPITTTKEPIRCPWYDTKIPHEKDCSLYYKCEDGELTLRRCYYGLHFNPRTKECDDPENVRCINKREAIYADTDDVDNIIGSTAKPTTPSWQSPASCIGRCPIVDPIEFTVLLPNRRCDKYCACSNGRAIVMSCPVGLQFSAKLNVCTYPVEAKCRGIGGIISSTSPAPSTTSSRRPPTGRPTTTSQKPISSSSTKIPSTVKPQPTSTVKPPVTGTPKPTVKPADNPSVFGRLFNFF